MITNTIVSYEPSDQITKQGKYSDIEKYLKSGYRIQEDRNGFWVLVRPLRLFVTLTNKYGTNKFEVKNEMLNYYNRQRISLQLIEQFEEDVNEGKITFEMNEDCSFYTMK
jgi:hypothetical protein